MEPTDSSQYTAHLSGISYLFGYPIAHSLSPLLHQTVYNALGLSRTQLLFPSTSISHFLRLLQDPKFYGASVTMPHKIAILPHLDLLTDEAREVGACNTIFVREVDGRRLPCGTNTDVVGIREAIFQNVRDHGVFRDRPGMVVGGGGAARSALYALTKWMGCGLICIVNRDAAEVETLMAACERNCDKGRLIHVMSVAQARSLESPGAIVACVPDFIPTSEEEVRVRQIVETVLGGPEKGVMLEMCYHPSPWTQLAELATVSGWQVILGTEAMIWQGLEQDRYWTGLPWSELPVEEVKAEVAKALSRTTL